MAVKAGRILSFLKIHVEGDDVQLAQLEAISNAMPAARRKTKASGDATPSVGEPRERRPRKSKNSVAANELESEGTTPDLASNEPASKAAATE
jgi:hypothetical protein